MDKMPQPVPKGFLFLLHLLKAGAQAEFRKDRLSWWILRAFMPCWDGSKLPLLQFMHVVEGSVVENKFNQVSLSATCPAKTVAQFIPGNIWKWEVNDVFLDQLEKDCLTIMDKLVNGYIYRMVDDCIAFQDSESVWLIETPNGEWDCETPYDCAVRMLAFAKLDEWECDLPPVLAIPNYED